MATEPATTTLRCSEIFGGNRRAELRLAMPGFSVAYVCRPHDGADVGGDVGFLSVCGEEHVARAFVGDVSGHGPAVGELAAALHDLLRRHKDEMDHAVFLRDLNDALNDREELSMATAVALSAMADSDELVYAYAGHPHLVLRSADGRLGVLDESNPACEARAVGAGEGTVGDTTGNGDPTLPAGLPVGALPGAGFVQQTARVRAGDVLLAYSDGLIEVLDADERQLGTDGLLEILREPVFDDLFASQAHPEAVARALLERVAEWSRGGRGLNEDDVTLVVLRRDEVGSA